MKYEESELLELFDGYPQYMFELDDSIQSYTATRSLWRLHMILCPYDHLCTFRLYYDGSEVVTVDDIKADEIKKMQSTLVFFYRGEELMSIVFESEKLVLRLQRGVE